MFRPLSPCAPARLPPYPSVGQLSKGDKVVVDSLANGWAHLMDTSAGTSRYVSAGYLKRLSDYDGKTEPDEPFTTGWYRVKVESKLAVRASASSTAKKVGQLSANAEVVVDSLANGWAHLMDTSKGTGRYVSANYLVRVRDYSARPRASRTIRSSRPAPRRSTAG